jgi:hypothetical protein
MPQKSIIKKILKIILILIILDIPLSWISYKNFEKKHQAKPNNFHFILGIHSTKIEKIIYKWAGTESIGSNKNWYNNIPSVMTDGNYEPSKSANQIENKLFAEIEVKLLSGEIFLIPQIILRLILCTH